ncbi:hypothetical protein ACHAXT_004454 [Thalassiosira profunda]
MEASADTPAADLQQELHRLREQNRQLQSQVQELTNEREAVAKHHHKEVEETRASCATSLDGALHAKERNGAMLPSELVRVRSSSLDGNDASPSHSGLHHRRVFRSGSNASSAEPINASSSYDSLPTPNRRQSLMKAKASDIIDSEATPLASNKPRVEMHNPHRRQFDPPPLEVGAREQRNKSPFPKLKGTKRSSDGGGRYVQALSIDDHGDEETGGFTDVRLETSTTDDQSESDSLIDDDSSHGKHMSRNAPGSPCSVIASPSNDFPSLKEQIKERGGWLIGLLVLQSCSSFIIQYNQNFLQSHMVIVQFLTMLVGAGGNAGNQASVRVIRSLALGTLNRHTMKPFLVQEAKMALSLSALLGLTGFIRALIFRTPWGETIAVTASVCAIVAISVAIGSTLPLGMKKVGIDPAHSSTTIQVVMDILGVLVTVGVSSFVLSFAIFQSEDSGASGGAGSDDGLR